MLILLRHGESEGNVAGRLLGQEDPPLTSLGERQAEAAGRFLALDHTDTPKLVLTSPLRRARATAEVVSAWLGNVEVKVEPRLTEMDYGSLDGRRVDEIDPAEWLAWRSDPAWRPRGGETLLELQRRVESWLEELAADPEGADIVAVSHVGPIKAAATWAIAAGPELSWRMHLSIAAITRVSVSPRSLRSFGETGHLAGLVS